MATLHCVYRINQRRQSRTAPQDFEHVGQNKSEMQSINFSSSSQSLRRSHTLKAKRDLFLALIDVAKAIISCHIPLCNCWLQTILWHSSNTRALVRFRGTHMDRKRVL